MSRVRLATCGKVLFGLALALQFGCNVLANRPIAFEDAQETAPLQVPPGLANPAPNPALQIPAVAGTGGTPGTAPPPLDGVVAVAHGNLPRASNSVLTLSDEPDSSWKRAGIALERRHAPFVDHERSERPPRREGSLARRHRTSPRRRPRE